MTLTTYCEIGPCAPPPCEPVAAVCCGGSVPCVVDWRRSGTIGRVALDKFLPHILKALSYSKEAYKVDYLETPEEILIDLARDAAMEFAERTGVLIRWMNFSSQACVSDYYLALTGDERINQVQHVDVDGTCIYGSGGGVGQDAYGMFGLENWRFSPPDMLQVSPAPTEDGRRDIHVKVSAVPANEACSVDSLLFDRYKDAIVYGALKRLYAPQAPSAVQYYTREFELLISAARNDIYNKFSSRQGKMMAQSARFG
jgi:hypothetical protein